MKRRLTKATIKELTENRPDKSTYVSDTEIQGFCLRIRPTGVPSYVYRYRSGKGIVTLTIGPATVLSPDEARARVQRMKLGKIDGVDPREQRRAIKKKMTMTELAERYMTLWAYVKKKPRPAANDLRIWNKDILPRWGHRAVDSITIHDVFELKADLTKRNPSAANAAIAVLSKAFNLSEAWEIRPLKSNPCTHVGKHRIEPRERILSLDELTRLGEAMVKNRDRFPQVLDLIELLLLTGARLNELAGATFSQYDRDRKIIDLPDSKTGKSTITLSAAAVAKIESIDRTGSMWLIPGPKPGDRIRSPWNAWREILKDADLQGLRIHDLRHVYGSYLHQYAGASQKTVQTLLRHKNISTTARYIQGFDDAARKSADDAGTFIRRHLQAKAHQGSA